MLLILTFNPKQACMRKNLLYLLAALLVLSSCDASKDQPEPEQVLFRAYYLQKQVANYVWPNGSTGTIEQLYSYNDQNQLIGISATTYSKTEPLHQTLSYNDNNQVVHIQSTPLQSWSNTYNENHQLIKQVRTTIQDDETTDVHYYQNTFNDAGELTEAQIRNIKDNVDEPGPVFKYAYTDGQVTSILSEYPAGGRYVDHFYTYDDKLAPLPSYLPQVIGIKYSSYFLPGKFPSQHNIASYIALDENGERKKIYCYTATYTYNEAGYPVTCTKNFEDGTVEKTTYTYVLI